LGVSSLTLLLHLAVLKGEVFRVIRVVEYIARFKEVPGFQGLYLGEGSFVVFPQVPALVFLIG
jgi:hypothetical protein